MINSKTLIKNGFVDDKKIIRAWESFTGWYWLATEKAYTQESIINGKTYQDTIWFGFVIGHFPEWGYFSQKELELLKPQIWEVKDLDLTSISKEA